MSDFSLVYKDWDLDEELLREALCALGNGYFATRGAGEESNSKNRRYPGTYLAGGFNRLESEINGRVIENEDLVNWPNWTRLDFKHAGGEWFDLESVKVLSYRQELDMKHGRLERTIKFRDSDDRETLLKTSRFVSMQERHLAGIKWKITPLNWSGEVEVRSGINGKITNSGVKRYRELSGQHLRALAAGKVGEQGIYLVSQTTQSEIVMAQAARTQIFAGGSPLPIERRTVIGDGEVEQCLSFKCEERREVEVEKVASLFTSKDHAITQPKLEAEDLVLRASRYDVLFKGHCLHWEQLWSRCDIALEDSVRENRVLRLHIFHLLQTVSLNSIDLDISVPSRGLHGEAYRGHIFWDEIFILPFLNLRIPDLTRSFLKYRYRRLDRARELAKEAGHRGAMYPWQSGSNGREESQKLHLNPVSGKWDPDPTHLQRHINCAIVYNIWQYYQSTNDKEFLSMYGAEMALEIARFWADKAQYNSNSGRFEIHNVVGPDEFHTAYPDSNELGINNNAYTNFMASWSIRKALSMYHLLDADRQKELSKLLSIEREELLFWERVSRKICVPMNEDGLILQFDGYDKLKELDWEHYRKKYKDIQRLDRILSAEGDTPNRYKLNKQADVLMLFYLFSSEELQEGFRWLGLDLDTKSIPYNIDYYLCRSSNGSTLSRMVHAWVLARGDRSRSWKVFSKALESDIGDIQGGTTAEGIHLGAMAGTVDIMQRCYTGIETMNDVFWLNPKLPKELRELSMQVRFRGHWIHLKVDQKKLFVKVEKSWMPTGRLGFKDNVYEFEQGSQFTFDLET